MSRRTIKTIRRPTPHPYHDAWGSCGRCELPRANSVHSAEAIAAWAARTDDAAEQDRRRTGEADD